VKLTPVMVTGVPTGPLGGAKLVIEGMTWNLRLLLSVPPGVETEMTADEIALSQSTPGYQMPA